MKSLLIWLAIATVTCTTGAGAYHGYLEASPRLVLIVLDSSYEMRAQLNAGKRLAEQLGTKRYARFALYSEKARVHGWTDKISAARLSSYGPRSLQGLISGQLGPEFSEADELHLITNAPATALAELDSAWIVHHLE
ncbi:MAG: hypothetical protein GKR94_13455 [Gammaproteobacteria bacterium]|nr:hypothetical protein [Gammaproteobacteria bacterium]